MADEKTIYEQGNIKITNLRAMFGDKTYSMSNITSVEKGMKPASTGTAAVFIIGGILLVIYGFSSGLNWVMIILGLILAVAGGYAVSTAKPEYTVQFGSSSGEIKAYNSTDQNEIKGIVEAINQAIIQKG